MGKCLSGKYGQKLFDTTTDALKTASKKAIQKVTEATGNLLGNKIVKKLIKTTSKNTCEDSRKSMTAQIQPTSIPKEIYIPKEKWQQIIDELRLL